MPEFGPRIWGALVGLSCIGWAASANSAELARLSLEWDSLSKIGLEMSLPNEALPDGVPLDFDWAQRPRLGAGNKPGGFSAVTGWGQLFNANGGVRSSIPVQMRNMQVLACYGQARKWVLLQQGEIEGNQFRPDFQENANKPPLYYQQRNGVTSVRFEASKAYHFWPKQGRVDLPAMDLCGIVVLLQAKALLTRESKGWGRSSRSSEVLIGLGADYWRHKDAIWDNYQSNQDVAIGRLRRVTFTWQWFGMSTASLEDLRRLYQFGFDSRAPNAQ